MKIGRVISFIFFKKADVLRQSSGQALRFGWRLVVFLILFAFLAGAMLMIYHSFRLPTFLSPVALYGALLLATFLMLVYVDKRPFNSIGLALHRRLPAELLQGVVVSGVMISTVFFVELGSGLLSVEFNVLTLSDIINVLFGGVAWFLIIGFGEELLFRGYIFQTLIEGIGAIAGTIVISLLFGLAHLWNPNANLLSVLNIVLAGIWLSIAYLRTRMLWLPIAMHFTWNFLEGTVFSFPVSGISMGRQSLLRITQHGPGWLTGGPFGPEGGTITTFVLVGGLFFVLFSRWFQKSEKAWIVEQREIERGVAS
ncbi:MAG: CPBP family intramembrane glutamic endopeptidase [Bacteroidota bacterium]